MVVEVVVVVVVVQADQDRRQHGRGQSADMCQQPLGMSNSIVDATHMNGAALSSARETDEPNRSTRGKQHKKASQRLGKAEQCTAHNQGLAALTTPRGKPQSGSLDPPTLSTINPGFREPRVCGTIAN